MATLEVKLADLRRREGLLEDAYLYTKRIDAITYERQRDTMREQIALATIELEDARLDQIDVEGLLGFAEYVLDERGADVDGGDGRTATATSARAFPRRAASGGRTIWNRRNVHGLHAVTGNRCS